MDKVFPIKNEKISYFGAKDSNSNLIIIGLWSSWVNSYVI